MKTEWVEELIELYAQGLLTEGELRERLRGLITGPSGFVYAPENYHPTKIRTSKYSEHLDPSIGEESWHDPYPRTLLPPKGPDIELEDDVYDRWGVTGLTEHDYDPANDPEWEAHDANMREMYGPNWQEIVHKEFVEDGSLRRMQEGLDKLLKEQKGEDKVSMESLFDDIEAEDKLGGLLSFLAEKGAKGSRLLGGAGMALYPSSTALDENEDVALMRQIQDELRRRRR